MLLSLKWLQTYLPDFQISNPRSFTFKVDTRLSEVDDIEQKGIGLEKLVIGQIVTANPHPKSGKLTVCEVDFGDGSTRQIICGAPNAVAGLVGVVCLPGGKVYNPENHTQLVEIGVREIAGVESNGMLCSAAELGLSTVHEKIIELPEGTPLGEDVTHLFKDTIISIENKAFPHRPDVFSHRGIAREFSAVFKSRFVDTNLSAEFIARAEDELPLKVDVREKGCPRFSAAAISQVTVKPSPLWLQVMLSYCGVRPINNVVDVTNYIMMDMGQPMHAFDYDKVSGGQIVVRKARNGEELTTLDDKKRELTSEMTVVADRDKALSVAGVMGGLDSEVTNQSTRLILEAANWEMYNIRRTSRDLGLRSEASTRYEKGISSETTELAVIRAANMLLDLTGAEVASDLVDVYPEPEEQKVVHFDLGLVSRLLGIQISKQDLLEILEAINLEVLEPEKIPADSMAMGRGDVGMEIMIRVPLYRRDINIPADILEEIGRFYGYENFPRTLPKRDLRPAPENVQFNRRVATKELMTASGLNEVLTYSMTGEEVYKNALLSTKNLLEVTNPISPELSFVRDSLVPSLLEKVSVNAAKFTNFGLFEISRIGLKAKTEDGLPSQPFKLAGVFLASNEELAYRQLKLAIDNLNTHYQDNITLSKANNLAPYFHPGKSGEIKFNGEVIGEIGVVHPKVITNLDLGKVGVAVFELNLDTLTNYNLPITKFIPLSKYPAVVRDMSFWQDSEGRQQTSLNDAVMAIKEANIAELENNSVAIIDTFVKDGRRSFTIRIVIQPREKTLTQEEIQARVEEAKNAIIKLGNEFRN